MIPYVEDFYSQQDANELFEFIKAQPFMRPPNPRNKTCRLKRLSFPGYSPPIPPTRAAREFKPPSNYDVSQSVADAPELYKKFAKRLSEFAGEEINYMSTIGYLPDDHMDFHQHEEDKKREDQTVWVLSLGAVHPVAIRPKGVKDKSQWEIIYPKHGSVYVLPSEYNLTHEHAVLYGNDFSYGGLRLAINTKHIPAGLSDDEMRKACSRPAGAPHEKLRAWVHPTLGLRVWCCRKGYEYPSNAVLVDRTTAWGNRYYLKTEKEFRAYAEGQPALLYLHPLRGKDLVCWCEPSEPWCHARVWMDLANQTVEPEPPKRTKKAAA